MNDDPIIILAIAAGTGYLLKMWLDDYKSNVCGKPHPKALPGAWPAPMGLVVFGIVAALLIVGIETGGEYALGVSKEQSDVVVFSLLMWISAGVIEELVMRGFLADFLLPKLGIRKMVFGVSVLFALLHVQYWIEFPEAEAKEFARDPSLFLDCRLKLGIKTAWTLLILFANSLLFFAVRYAPQNKKHSLLPCIAAHIASNLGVFLVKLAQGHVVGIFPVGGEEDAGH